MSKKRIDQYIPKAINVLKQTGIVKGDTIEKAFRSQIASFGAAITMGSLISAVAFYSVKGEAKSDRQNLMKALYAIIKNLSEDEIKNLCDRCLFELVNDTKDINRMKEEIIDAAVALKLAMNMYTLIS